MAAVKRLALRAMRAAGERGSALLVTLMVMVGLSLIGLGYVALSETESAIAVNERNAAQTLHVAEAGGLMVIEWFQNPRWARTENLMPPNVNAIKVERRLTGLATPYIGRYKSAGTKLLADKPFKPDHDDRFYGTEDNPDVLINDRTLPVWLAEFNIALFNRDGTATGAAGCGGCDNREGGRITEIRIYAPPVDGAVRNTEDGWSDPTTSGIPAARGFYEGGTRFGIATVKVTATKFNKPDCGPWVEGCRTVAQRSVKFVIAEWPFPGPQGPLQTNANIGATGDYHVHWGRVTSTLDAFLKRPYTSIPWIDAFNHTPFERGYEAAPFPGAPKSSVWPTNAKSGSNLDNHNWFNELIGRTYEDPWYQARARGHIVQMKGTSPTTDSHQFRYEDPAHPNVPGTPVCDPCNAGDAKAVGQSNFFQYQTKSEQRYWTNALFPRIDYDFWKQVAISADSQDNIYYLRWVTKDEFEDRAGNRRTFRQWVDVFGTPPVGTGPKSKPGFYFFDTENRQNPQNSRGGILTPKIDMSGGNMQMKGFVYVNAKEIAITGLDGYAHYYNMPGEVYRDIGYRAVDTATKIAWESLGVPPCSDANPANCRVVGALNNRHDYQDLPWSRGGAAINDELDVFLQGPVDLTRTVGGNLTNQYFVVPWYPGCVPGRNGDAGANCSEPHEPYLNFIYPPSAAGSIIASSTPGIKAGWEQPGKETRLRKTNPAGVRPGKGALPGCAGASITDCTSNSYDKDGPLVELSPILDGVFYNEGKFGSAGKAHYFGSLLFEQAIDASGTPDIWFDEKLIKGAWPPGNFGFPRVYITTYETDQ